MPGEGFSHCPPDYCTIIAEGIFPDSIEVLENIVPEGYLGTDDVE